MCANIVNRLLKISNQKGKVMFQSPIDMIVGLLFHIEKKHFIKFERAQNPSIHVMVLCIRWMLCLFTKVYVTL